MRAAASSAADCAADADDIFVILAMVVFIHRNEINLYLLSKVYIYSF